MTNGITVPNYDEVFQSMNLDKKEIAWYAWRWSQSFGYNGHQCTDLSTEWITIFRCCRQVGSRSRPYENEYSAAAVRFFRFASYHAWSDENKILCYDELIGKCKGLEQPYSHIR